jgi:glycogen(starch) synthase
VRICHFTSTFFPRVGGVEIVVSNLARRQHDLGHSVIVITPRIRGIDNRVQVPYQVIHYDRPSSKRYLTRQVLLRLLWEHFKHPFDVVHCHSAYPHGYVSATFSRLTGVPVIITPHGPTDIMREEQIRRHPTLEKRMAKGLRTAAGITAISKDILKEILSVGEIPEENVRIIPNGVNLSEFAGVEPAQAGSPYVFAMGRMVHQKGFDQLIRAFVRVSAEAPDLHLFLAGEGINRRDYEQLVRNLGLETSVKFLGLVQGPQKVSLMKGAEFFVCPSRFEPFGIVVLEALAAGAPVIASPVGGIVDIVEDQEQGILADPSDGDSLASAIIALHRDPRRRAKMRVKALAKAADYDWSVINQMYLEMYQRGISAFAGNPKGLLAPLLAPRRKA